MKIRIFLKGYNANLLDSVCKNLQSILLSKKCQISGIISLPMRIKRFCVLRSPHIDNDSREHFEIRLSKRFFDINYISKEIIDFLLEMEFPSGISPTLKFI